MYFLRKPVPFTLETKALSKEKTGDGNIVRMETSAHQRVAGVRLWCACRMLPKKHKKPINSVDVNPTNSAENLTDSVSAH
jgi:hypothetical protein